jgi:hypothetical protein
MDASPRQGCLIHFEKRLPLSSSPEAAACLPEIVNG